MDAVVDEAQKVMPEPEPLPVTEQDIMSLPFARTVKVFVPPPAPGAGATRIARFCAVQSTQGDMPVLAASVALGEEKPTGVMYSVVPLAPDRPLA